MLDIDGDSIVSQFKHVGKCEKKSTLINKILISFFDNRITFKSWLMRHFSAHSSSYEYSNVNLDLVLKGSM